MSERYNPIEYSLSLKLPSPTATMVMMMFEATAHRLTPYRSMADVMRRVGCKKHAFKRALKTIVAHGAATITYENGYSVVRFNHFALTLEPMETEVRDDPWQVMRARVFATKGCLCAYCERPASHVDHVIPKAKGGSDLIENLVPACARCNSAKSDMTLEEWRGQQ